MSLYGALFTGVTGLTAQTQSIGIISDNIANVNTVGYKGNVARFETLVIGGATPDSFSPGGVRARSFARIGEQGTITGTTSATDVAVSGRGFFVVNTNADGSGEPLYTRAGSFNPDANGNLVNTAGMFLQGWALDADGNLPAGQENLTSLESVNVGQVTGAASPTTAASLGLNLRSEEVAFPGAYTAGDMATGTVTPHFSRNVVVFDALGSAQELTIGFLKTGVNTWEVEVFADPARVTATDGLIDSGTLVFNGNASIAADNVATTLGNFDPVTGRLTSTLNIDWTNGAAPSSIGLTWGTNGLTDGITQFDAAFDVNFVNQNGATVGQLNNISITDEGIVVASFSNGETQQLYKLPLALFANPAGLEARSGNVYAQSLNSGPFSLREVGSGGAGLIVASALEQSNVDIAKEFTDMITTQRAYSANTRVITTVDDMLDELIRLKR